ncbi:hypothetical protein BV20DRAFT_54312 [Pilatotrama ljubarskyi]|nr:hypothetical protein BV20DRAFT_54312 [Pilatotrama ljubarskyi]
MMWNVWTRVSAAVRKRQEACQTGARTTTQSQQRRANHVIAEVLVGASCLFWMILRYADAPPLAQPSSIPPQFSLTAAIVLQLTYSRRVTRSFRRERARFHKCWAVAKKSSASAP